MRRRIGTKIYDTDTAELVHEDVFGKLYRKRTRGREWFAVSHDPAVIDPLTDAQARAILGESTYREPAPESKRTWIAVDWETHDRLSRAAKAAGVSITEEVRRLAAQTVI